MCNIVEFRIIEKMSSTDCDKFLSKNCMEVVPLPGETINIGGNPYIVHERGFAVIKQSDMNYDDITHVYIRVIRAF